MSAASTGPHRRPLRTTDPEILGWDEWLRQFPTVLVRLLEHIVRIGPYYLPTRKLVAALPEPPASDWARVAARALDDHHMSAIWRAHSMRTWYFASTLAGEDYGDRKGLYVAALLHDIGFFADLKPGQSFTDAGARIAAETAAAVDDVDPDTARRVATAIRNHISLTPDDDLGRLIQFGSLLDLTATGIWKVDRGLVARVYHEHSRTGLGQDARDRWTNECVRIKYGRAAYARRPGLLLAAARIAPLPPRVRGAGSL